MVNPGQEIRVPDLANSSFFRARRRSGRGRNDEHRVNPAAHTKRRKKKRGWKECVFLLRVHLLLVVVPFYFLSFLAGAHDVEPLCANMSARRPQSQPDFAFRSGPSPFEMTFRPPHCFRSRGQTKITFFRSSHGELECSPDSARAVWPSNIHSIFLPFLG